MTKKVFISYSWDDEAHKEWVLALADKLSANGVYVFLDRYDLHGGKDKTHFMENSVKESNKVLLIMTPNFKVKVENREGGVGYETSMITAEIFNNQATEKFIPIVRLGTRGECTPIFVKSKIDIDMSDDAVFDEKFDELLRAIYDEHKIKRSLLGNSPNFEPKINQKKFVIELDDNFRVLQSELMLQDIFVQIAELRSQGKDYTLEYNIEDISEKYNRFKSLRERNDLSENDLKIKLKLQAELKATFFRPNNATLYDYLDCVIYSIIDYYYNRTKILESFSELATSITNCFTLFSKRPVNFPREGIPFDVFIDSEEFYFRINVLQKDIDRWYAQWGCAPSPSDLKYPYCGKNVYDLSDSHDRIINEFIPKQAHLFATECFHKRDDEDFKQTFFSIGKWQMGEA